MVAAAAAAAAATVTAAMAATATAALPRGQPRGCAEGVARDFASTRAPVLIISYEAYRKFAAELNAPRGPGVGLLLCD